MIKRKRPHLLDTVVTIIDANGTCYDIPLRAVFVMIKTGVMDEHLPDGFVLNEEVQREGLKGVITHLRAVVHTDPVEADRLEALLPRVWYEGRLEKGRRVPDGLKTTPLSYSPEMFVKGG